MILDVYRDRRLELPLKDNVSRQAVQEVPPDVPPDVPASALELTIEWNALQRRMRIMEQMRSQMM